MKGHNCLQLCELQMQVIVQEWIDRNFATRPKVRSVSPDREGGFTVRLSDEERPELT